MLKTILITGAIGMVVGFAGTLLTLFGGGSVREEYLEFAVALLLFLVMLFGAYWSVVSQFGSRGNTAKEETLTACGNRISFVVACHTLPPDHRDW